MNAQQARLDCFKSWSIYRNALRDNKPKAERLAAEKNFRERRAIYIAARNEEAQSWTTA